MSRISYIRGHVPTGEYRDRAANIGTKPFIPAVGLTDGQLGAMLLHRQLNILARYYPDIPDYRIARDAVAEALKSGVHPADINSGGSDFVRAINRKLKGYKIKRRKVGINGGDEMGNFLIQHYLAGGTDTPEEYEHQRLCAAAYNAEFGTNYNRVNDARRRDREDIYEYCRGIENNIKALNRHVDDGSHHLLYEWATNDAPTLVKTKQILHSNAISSFAGIISASRSNMRAWFRTGILEKNAQGGQYEPIGPEGTYAKIADHWSRPESASVGEPVTITVIVGAIIAAATAVSQLIDNLNAQKRQQL
ncbi:MAG: hypothetical protein AAFY91_13220, partial [Bacteroidota bacterium]